jgi:hypothetical protein
MFYFGFHHIPIISFLLKSILKIRVNNHTLFMSKAALGLAIVLAVTFFLVYDQTAQDSQLQTDPNTSSADIEKPGTPNIIKKYTGLQRSSQGEKTQQNYTFH